MLRRTFLASPVAFGIARSSPTIEPSKLAADHQRPKYHFLPAANWMNDPNGPIYWRGRYHMFYQHNPNGAFWGTMHWGHATSPDMIHWKHEKIALAPTPGGHDKNGVYSGCAVKNNGVPTLIYTGTQPEVQCMATSRDGLNTWTKRAEPIISGPPEGLKVTGFRDPCVWHEDDGWYMALGSGIVGVGGCVLLYKSPDLIQWTYLHPLYQGQMDPKITGQGSVSSGEMWECPSFFALGDKHVLFVSTKGGTPYYVGDYKNLEFIPEAEGHMDAGAYYAPITQLDERGRRIVWGWVKEQRSSEAQKAAGWSGVLSLPRELTVGAHGGLEIHPVAQTRLLRGSKQTFVNLFIPSARPLRVPDLRGDALEMILEIDPADSDECGLQLLVSPDGSEFATVGYNRARKQLHAGSLRSTQDGNLILGHRELLRLHIFVDCSVIEVFANGRTCLTARSYSTAAAHTGVSLYAHGGTAKLRSMQVFDMKPISNDRLTS